MLGREFDDGRRCPLCRKRVSECAAARETEEAYDRACAAVEREDALATTYARALACPLNEQAQGALSCLPEADGQRDADARLLRRAEAVTADMLAAVDLDALVADLLGGLGEPPC